jgi:hypothetical protein
MQQTRYVMRINKRLRYIRVYNIVKKVSNKQNPLTKVFMKVFGGKKGDNGEA